MNTPASAPPPGPEPVTPAMTPVQAPRNNSGGAFALLTVLGGLLLVVGSFLPWVAVMAPFVGTMSRNGLDGGGDGIVTLVAGVATLTVGAARLMTSLRPGIQRLPILFGALALLIAVMDLSAVSERVASVGSSPFVQAYAGSGLYLLVVGAVVTGLGGLAVSRPGTSASRQIRTGDHVAAQGQRMAPFTPQPVFGLDGPPPAAPPAGWYPDPAGIQRWWDGNRWTAHTQQ